MIAWILSGILLIVIIILSIKLSKKVQTDYKELNNLNLLVEDAKRQFEQLLNQKKDLQKDICAQRDLIEENNEKIKSTKDEINKVEAQYNRTMRDRTQELDTYFEDLRAARQQELDEYAKKAKSDNDELVRLQYENTLNTYQKFEKQAKERAECADRAASIVIDEAYDRATKAIEGAKEEEAKFEAILAPLRQYEKEKQERLFYTIQVPDEYKDDIEFLLTTVAEKIQHPDVINKLVWTEYVKPYIAETFKRANIEEKPGIYKITNINDGKCYIGKSTNIKKRLTDHFKASIGISSISWQAVHDAILKEGCWNWTIEPIIYCEKDKLSELEKYYISFFKSNIYGFNKTNGGE